MEYSVKESIDEITYGDILEIVNTSIPWELLSNSTVLITGANGFIGYYLTLSLLLRNDLYNENIKVIAMARNKRNAFNKFQDLLNRDDLVLTISDVCENIELTLKSDYVIHAASQASAYHFEHDPVGTINANLRGTDNILKYALKCNAKSVLFISSLKVYGSVDSTNGTSLKETDIGFIDYTSYKNCYAEGKRAAETLCHCYNKQYKLPVKIARPAYIYGAASLEDDRVWAQFIANIVKNEDILLKSSGLPYRSFCYVSDTASAILTILLEGENVKPYNISAEHSNITIRDFARTAVEAFPERNLKLTFFNKEDEKMSVSPPSGIVPEILDNSSLTELGWTPHVDLTEGIRRSAKILSIMK